VGNWEVGKILLSSSGLPVIHPECGQMMGIRAIVARMPRNSFSKAKRALAAAAFSAILSAAVVSLYFTVYIAIETKTINAIQLLNGFMMIAGFAVPIGGVFGFVLGFIGESVLSRLTVVKTRVRLVMASAALGAILGSVPPAVARLSQPPHAPEDLILGVAPCVLIGIFCASTWALLSRRNKADVERPESR